MKYFISEFEVTSGVHIDISQFRELELIDAVLRIKEEGVTLWERIGYGGSISGRPTVYKNIIFFGACDKNFYALTLDGKEKWRFQTNGIVTGNSSVGEGKVFFASRDKNVYAVDAQKGKLMWKFKSREHTEYPFFHGNAVFVASYDCNIYALDAEKGNELWRLILNTPVTGISIKDNKMYFGYRDKIFYAYTLDRKLLWKFSAGDVICAWETSFWRNLVYVASYDSNFYALDKDTGRLVWKFTAKDTTFPAKVYDSKVYFGSRDYSTYCLDAETGGFVSTPDVSEGRVYIGSFDNNVYCLDANTGKEIWKFKTNGFVNYCRFYNNTLYFGSWDCNLYAVDAETGKLIWKFRTSIGTPSPIEPPETSEIKTVETVWEKEEEEKPEEKKKEREISDYGKIESDYTGASKDYTKGKKGYI